MKNIIKKTGQKSLLTLLLSCIGISKSFSDNNYVDLRSVNNLLKSIPLCGTFCQGETVQINVNSHLHSYSSCWGLLVKRKIY